MSARTALLLPLALLVPLAGCWNEGAVLLRDVQVLTLHRGRYTAARRSGPVLQLQCSGGSAGCGAFAPEVVQCRNRGWDGVDVQWECKADLDNAYRFGKIEVNCEGFNHPDDPYILKGSCGLEYTLELTEEGRSRRSRDSQSWGGGGGFGQFASSFFNGYSNNKQHYQSSPQYQQDSGSGEGAGGLLVIGLLLLMAYGVYKMFLCGPTQGQGQARFPDDGNGAWNREPDYTGPPPPGFKPDYTGAGYSSSYPGSNPGYGFADSYTRPRAAGGGGGFWTGMGAGGLLGYLFGNQRRQPSMGPAWGSTYKATKSPPASTGTRTASGFGGTKRR
ncbi:store-operated calcium entry-associated regulatory factor [Denticeps clupeoides]|uniref:Store-operated calcium entry-associated regulatory factor n=1 Tax=Denticeps clupeoides TaxID=299321 RepID=A0AAY3ZYX1_9TELE|nr:store-operated calcium entry-associated regulatory factor [Denticeps clupeoides]